MKKSTFLMAALLCGSWCATAQTTEKGYEYVDLGLPSGLQWATCNVGATTPEGYGNYYAWGETEPKDTYTWSNYKWCNGSTVDNTQVTKYCNDSFGQDGFKDNKTVLDLEDDAANVNWGGKWRMPTDAEWTELRENCTWTWTSDYNGTGVAGRIVTSKTNSNSIFLPAAGYRGDYQNYTFDGNNYWSSSLNDYSKAAMEVAFDESKVGRYSQYRRYGLSIRPVLMLTTYSITLTAEHGTVTGAGIYPQDTEVTLTATPDEGYHFVEWSDGTKNPTYTFTLTGDMSLTAIFEGDPHTVTVTAGENGSVKVAANGAETAETVFAYGTEVTLTATANEGYHFVQWSDSNTKNPRTITVTADVTLAAEFAATPTALEAVMAAPVYAENGRIVCEGDFRIYDLLGRDVTRLNGSLCGVYVVKVGEAAVKVVVK
ncbi:MAG: InlB B-repeat-containing protein [Paludibacteraceae bacterium]